jgi:hypothetical protein
VINQTVGPANTGDILYFMRVLLFIAFLGMGYSLSQPTPAGNKEQYLLLADTTGTGSQEQEWAGLPPWQRRASEKAVISYAAAQEKKWRRWNEAMFERSG